MKKASITSSEKYKRHIQLESMKTKLESLQNKAEIWSEYDTDNSDLFTKIEELKKEINDF